MKVALEDLLRCGVHFGHLTRRWNPKMRPYIFLERNNIHIIDLKKTLECLQSAYDVVKDVVAAGNEVLFVGTKKQAKEIVQAEAARCGMPYIAERWLGGTLTNFATIKKSIRKLEGLEKKVHDGTVDKLTKKERLQIEREIEKMKKIFLGIQEMKRIPSVMFLVDTRKEDIAVKEARKLGIPIIAIVDTNSDPDVVDYPIPGNDDSTKSIGLITKALVDAVVEAKAVLEARRQDQELQRQKDKEKKIKAKKAINEAGKLAGEPRKTSGEARKAKTEDGKKNLTEAKEKVTEAKA